MPRFVRQPNPLPTAKVTASTLAALGAPFLVDVLHQVWPAMPPSAEPFIYALFVFLAGWWMPEIDRTHADSADEAVE